MKKPDKSTLMAMVVKLFYIDRKSQKDIAEIAGISQPLVSNLLAQARDAGMIQVTVGHYNPRNTDLEKKLKLKYGLNIVGVIRTWKKQQRELYYKNIGYFAASIITEILRPNITVCLSAGRQIAYLIREMTPQNIPGISVLQTMGSIGLNIEYYDAIEVGRKFADLFGGKFYQLQAPAIASTPEEKNVFIKNPQIRTVLEMIQNTDLAIVGIGTPTDSVYMEGKFFTSKDIASFEKKKIVGGIGGHFFDIKGDLPKTKYRDCVIGISLEQLKRIPEVVAIASGLNRVKGIFAAIKAGYIKSLITDEETAEALIQCA